MLPPSVNCIFSIFGPVVVSAQIYGSFAPFATCQFNLYVADSPLARMRFGHNLQCKIVQGYHMYCICFEKNLRILTYSILPYAYPRTLMQILTGVSIPIPLFTGVT